MRVIPCKKAPAKAAFLCLLDDQAFLSLPAALQASCRALLKRQSCVAVPSHGLIDQAWLVVAQAVDSEADSARAWRLLGGRLASAARGQQLSDACIHASGDSDRDRMLLLGLAQGAYRWERYRPTKSQGPELKLHLIGARRSQLDSIGASISATALCRDLVNTPTADLGPAEFVRLARQQCRGTGLKLRVMDESACRQAGMGCLTAVGRAAAVDRRPRLLIIDWPGQHKGKGKKATAPLALCGKGVCFDTGGLQIKPGKSMELMRKDMGGAATVLAAMLGLAADKGKRPVRAYLPLVENAIDGSAFRPGDILTAMDGTTVEVGHTDAEGRLILADAICLAKQEGAAGVVTVATLTGAALIALGRIHVPLMGSQHGGLVQGIEEAAATCGEQVWQLPLQDEHRAMIKSPVATITNSAGPDASCITAGAFLQHFAQDLPFAHCDISPASYMPGDHDLGPAGATGVLVDSLRELAVNWTARA